MLLWGEDASAGRSRLAQLLLECELLQSVTTRPPGVHFTPIHCSLLFLSQYPQYTYIYSFKTYVHVLLLNKLYNMKWRKRESFKKCDFKEKD